MGGKGDITRQKERLDADAIALKASAKPAGSSEDGIITADPPELG